MKYTLAFITSLTSCLLLCAQAFAAVEKTNIIFLLTDDQTIAALGYYGNKDIITPNLDKLASEGVRFTSPKTASK